MELIRSACRRSFAAAAFCVLAALPAAAQTPVLSIVNACARPAAGTVVQEPPALTSVQGVLSVRFSYQHAFDAFNRELFCFMTPDGLQNPTLHVRPGDHLILVVTNNLPVGSTPMALNAPNCGAQIVNSTSVNIDYHGTNTSPTCHQDEVIKTVINSGQTFQYDVVFPTDEPPGLYFYHPQVHGIAEHAVQGGATGAIVVDGVERLQPAVSALLPQRILMVRDQPVPGNPAPGGNIPSWDVTLNYVPITSPTHASSDNFVPSILQMRNNTSELWSIGNAAADTVLDLEYVFDGVPQPLQIVAIDGVPVNSQDGAVPGAPIPVTHFLLPPASRVQAIVSAPPTSVGVAQLITLGIDTGPDGDNDPQRPLATVRLGAVQNAGTTAPSISVRAPGAAAGRSAVMKAAPITVHRTLFFDEIESSGRFFMAVEGRPEHVFDPNAPPDIVTTQNTVEEWTVQNRTQEVHEFHLNQVHFLVESQDNFEVNGSPQQTVLTGQFLDMIQVPHWDGDRTHPFPSVTLRIDFRESDIGDFLFQCHILEHADRGMMNIIRVRDDD